MSWSYDAHGRVTGKGQTVASITKSVGYAYTNADLTSIVTPSGQTVIYGYTNHRVTSISIGSTTLLSGVTNGYTVDNAERITGISDSGLSSASWTFGFDALDRVTSGLSSAKSRGYSYDANSNRLTTTGTTASTETISTINNRLSSTGGGLVRTYVYDAAGNTTSFTGENFTFNKRGRMATAVNSGGTTNYIYNALGQLIEKFGNGGTTLLVFDEAGR